MSSFAAMWSPLVFGFAMFLGAALLFFVQPMLGRTLLPHLGGNQIAWNACLVFFQATLLAAYVYANLIHRFRGLRWQPWLQLLLLAAATILCFAGVLGDKLLLEIAPRLTDLESWPILETLCLLIVVIGLPFFVLAAVSPLVQRWFAHLDHPKSSDPYFLFVASNLGGLTALVIYALLIEPFSPLYAQWLAWKLAVTALGVLLFVTALCAWQSPRSPELEPAAMPSDPAAPLIPRLIGRGQATWPRRFYWLFASALPVGLMMGATDFLTTDVAPAPIFWTVPLALYLIAFSQSFARFSPFDYGNRGFKLSLQVGFGVLVFFVTFLLVIVLVSADQARVRNDFPSPAVGLACIVFFAMLMLMPFSWLGVLQPLSALAVVFLQANLGKQTFLGPGMILLYLSCFYLSVRLCLGMLARDRPAAASLTTYYTWMGLGGLCGGLFQLLLAPLLFRRDYLEYSLLAALACTLRAAWIPHGLSDWLVCLLLFPKRKEQSQQTSSAPAWIARGFDIALAALVAVFAVVMFLLRGQIQPFQPRPGQGAFEQAFLNLISDVPLILALMAALVLFARPLRFGLALTAIVALCWIGRDSRIGNAQAIVERRTAFGILRVTQGTQQIRVQGRDGPNQPNPARYTERVLMHGTTNHGSCITDPPELLRYPTAYYHRKGRVGQVMRNLEWFREPAHDLFAGDAAFWFRRNRDNAKDDARIAASLIGMGAGSGATMNLLTVCWSEPPFALVGLGTGTQFAYAHPYQYVDAYELDPAIIDLSKKNPPTFHYYQSALARGVDARIISGDARRNLNKPGRESFYHVMFVDAFNSDAIPVHLVTQEAVEIYFRNLAADGAVCFHTSNRYVDLPSVLNNIANRLSLSCKVVTAQADPGGEDPGFFTSELVVLTRTPEGLRRWTSEEPFKRRPDGKFGHQPVLRRSAKLLWTDEHASLLSAVRPEHGWPALIYGLLIMVLFFGIFLGMIEIAFAMMARSGRRQGDRETGRPENTG
jgi:hypothetical protein